jgi:hypothetical protein
VDDVDDDVDELEIGDSDALALAILALLLMFGVPLLAFTAVASTLLHDYLGRSQLVSWLIAIPSGAGALALMCLALAKGWIAWEE